jgi:hypothetical protein
LLASIILKLKDNITPKNDVSQEVSKNCYVVVLFGCKQGAKDYDSREGKIINTKPPF